MPTVRLVPVADVSPNSFSVRPSGAHWSAIGENILFPNVNNYIRTNTFDKIDRIRFSALPEEVQTITNITVSMHHSMEHGNGAFDMTVGYRVYVGGSLAGSGPTNPVPNEYGPATQETSHAVSLSPGAIEVEIHTDDTDITQWEPVLAWWTIYTINLDVTYTAVLPPSAEAISGVIQVKQTGDFQTTNGAWQYTNVLANMPFIPGAQLPAGTTWLVRYHASHGATAPGGGGSSRQNETILVSGASTDTVYAHSSFKGLTHGTPDSIRGGTMDGWYIHTGDGTDLRFGLRALSGVASTWSDMEIIAVPLASLPQGGTGAYFYSQAAFTSGDPSSLNIVAGGSPGTIHTLTNGAASTGTYLILATCESKCSAVGDGAVIRLYQNSTLLREWKAESFDARDRFSFVYEGIVSISSAGEFTLEGSDGKGSGTKDFIRPRIIAIKLDSFVAYEYSQALSQATVTGIQPAYQMILSGYHYPENAESLLVIGNATVWRTDAAAMIARVKDRGTGLPIGGFSTTVNTSGTNFDRQTLSSVACINVNGVGQYAFEVTGEAGYPATGQISNAWLVLLGLTKNLGPIQHTIMVGDTTALFGTDHISGDVGEGIGVFDTTALTDSVVVTTSGPPPASIPTTHPRLWFYNNSRLSYIRGQAGYNDSGVQVNPPGSTRWQTFAANQYGGRQFFSRCLKYMVTQSAADLALVNADIDSFGTTYSMSSLMYDKDGLEWRESARSLACCYDWMGDIITPERKQRLKDTMLASLYCLMNPGTAISNAILANPAGSVTHMTGWALNNPTQNFFSAFQMGAAYIGIALYYEQPTSFTWPPITGTTYQFSLRYHPEDDTSPLYTDIFQWAVDRLDGFALDEWDSYAEGGIWPEGSNYGPAALRHQTEMACILRDSAGLNYLGSHAYFKQIMYYELYEQQPGNDYMIQLGDAARERTLVVNDYVRWMLLMLIYGFQGSPEAQWLQWWADNQSGPMGGTTNYARGFEFLFYNHLYASADYRSVLPTYYRGGGFVNARSDWTTGSYSATFTSTDFLQDHQHEDQNQIQIWSGIGIDGWLLCDPNVFASGSGLGDFASAVNHSTYDVDGWGQAYRGTATSSECGRIDRFIGTTRYVYAQGNCNDAYYTKKTNVHVGTPQTKINDIFLREFMFVQGTGVAYILAFDRFRLLPAFYGSAVKALWQYGKNQPVEVTPGDPTLTALTIGTSRLFRKHVLGYSALFASTFSDYVNPDAWKETVPVATTNGYARLFTMFQVCTNADSMVANTTITDTGGMEGVTIKDSGGWVHSVFSTAQAGLAGATVSYRVTKNASSDLHIVCNLLPSTRYVIVETNVSGSTYQYTVAQNVGGKLTSPAGTLEFTPATMGGTLSHLIDVGDTMALTDGVTYNISWNTSHQDTTAVDDVLYSAVPNQHLISVGDTTALTDVLTIPMISIHLSDSTAGVDSASLTTISGIPGTSFVEKTIVVNNPIIRPNSDAGSSFVTTEPNDNTIHTKWMDSSDDSFVSFTYPNFTSVAIVGLDDLSLYVRRLLGVKMYVRVRRMEPAGVIDPKINVSLYNSSLTSAYATLSAPLQTTDQVVEYSSGSFPVALTDEQADDMVLVVRPSNSGGNPLGFVLQVSQVRLEVFGDPIEKVID